MQYIKIPMFFPKKIKYFLFVWNNYIVTYLQEVDWFTTETFGFGIVQCHIVTSIKFSRQICNYFCKFLGILFAKIIGIGSLRRFFYNRKGVLLR